MRFKVILAPVKTEKTDRVVDAAKRAGATGATIIPARGTGMHEAKTFFGLTLEVQTDVIMFLIEEHMVQDILDAIKAAGEFSKPGTGIAFVLPVEQVIGVESEMEQFRIKARD
jgi:nitrogen regulatory protein P-II 1